MAVKYAIQAVRARWPMAMELRNRLDAVICVDRNNHSTKAFLESLLVYGGDGHIHLEDDVELCEDFEHRAQNAVLRFPNDVIHFFLGEIKNPVRHPRRCPAAAYNWGQCIYFPPGFGLSIMDWSLGEGRDAVDLYDCDKFTRKYLEATRRSWIRWFPSLVQHRVGESSIAAGRRRARQTPFFADRLRRDTSASWIRGRDNGFATDARR